MRPLIFSKDKTMPFFHPYLREVQLSLCKTEQERVKLQARFAEYDWTVMVCALLAGASFFFCLLYLFT